ncbi:MAG: polysaccharide deacetylase family protein [Terriglobales bacterium]
MMAHLSRRLPEPLLRTLCTLPRAPWPYCVTAFHRVAGDGEELSYPAAAFTELCRYWKDHYQIVTLDCLLARLAHHDPAAGPTLAITFDDGYADNAEVAADILDRLGLSATFFITTGAIDLANRFPWDAHLAAPPRLMDWTQVHGLHAAGFGIGSHTISHPRLSRLTAAELDCELAGSRARLEQELGEPVSHFAYPFGGREGAGLLARTAVAAAGYACCLSCHGGLIAAYDSPFHLNRVAVSPRWHADPRAWARAYARLRWRPPAAPPPHW